MKSSSGQPPEFLKVANKLLITKAYQYVVCFKNPIVLLKFTAIILPFQFVIVKKTKQIIWIIRLYSKEKEVNANLLTHRSFISSLSVVPLKWLK